MLIHPWDAGDEAAALAFARSGQLGHLVAAGRGREVPVVVPTQFVLDGERTVLLHLARPNPVWAAIAENPAVVLSLAGDWAYVPGAWKVLPGEGDPSLGIPTTYYAAVQLIGRAEIVTDPEGKLAILRAQLGELDPALADPEAHRRRLNGILGLRLEVAEIRAKFKYGGNADAEHRAHIAERLEERRGPGDLAALAHLRG